MRQRIDAIDQSLKSLPIFADIAKPPTLTSGGRKVPHGFTLSISQKPQNVRQRDASLLASWAGRANRRKVWCGDADRTACLGRVQGRSGRPRAKLRIEDR